MHWLKYPQNIPPCTSPHRHPTDGQTWLNKQKLWIN